MRAKFKSHSLEPKIPVSPVDVLHSNYCREDKFRGGAGGDLVWNNVPPLEPSEIESVSTGTKSKLWQNASLPAVEREDGRVPWLCSDILSGSVWASLLGACCAGSVVDMTPGPVMARQCMRSGLLYNALANSESMAEWLNSVIDAAALPPLFRSIMMSQRAQQVMRCPASATCRENCFRLRSQPCMPCLSQPC